MAIQERYDTLDQEILNAAKVKNHALVEQKVASQKKLSEILDKREKEEKIFTAEKQADLFEDDALYAKAKEANDQELLEKFHTRSLTRTAYLKACKAYHVEKGVDYYYNTLERFDYVGNFENGFAVVRIGDKKGFINEQGEEICEIKYDQVWNFENGFAVIRIGDKRGFINEQGEEICEIKYDQVWNFENGFAVVRIGDKRGFINEQGEYFDKIPE